METVAPRSGEHSARQILLSRVYQTGSGFSRNLCTSAHIGGQNPLTWGGHLPASFLIHHHVSLSTRFSPGLKPLPITKSVTGGEVKASISGGLLHDLFEGRGTDLLWCFSS